MSKPFFYNGINFNTDWSSKITEAEFVKEFTTGRPAAKLDVKQQANFDKFEKPYDLTDDQLKEAYKLAKEHVNNQKSADASGAVQLEKSSSAVTGGNKGVNSGSERPANDVGNKK